MKCSTECFTERVRSVSQNVPRNVPQMFHAEFKKARVESYLALAWWCSESFKQETHSPHSVSQSESKKAFLEGEKVCTKTHAQYHFGGRSRRILMVCFGSVMSNQRP